MFQRFLLSFKTLTAALIRFKGIIGFFGKIRKTTSEKQFFFGLLYFVGTFVSCISLRSIFTEYKHFWTNRLGLKNNQKRTWKSNGPSGPFRKRTSKCYYSAKSWLCLLMEMDPREIRVFSPIGRRHYRGRWFFGVHWQCAKKKAIKSQPLVCA